MSDLKVKKESVIVYGTGAGLHLKRGKEAKLHPIAAQKLIDKGIATKTKPK